MIQPLIPHGSVLAFNVRGLLWVIRLDKHDLNAFAYSPGGQQTTDVFWAIITAYSLGLAKPSRQRKAHLNGRPFPVKVVNHVK